MKKLLLIGLSLMWSGLFSVSVQAATEGALGEGMVNPGFYEKPAWFKDSFLELPDELQEANDNNKQLVLYFHQDGCPYCKKLLDDNFTDEKIISKMDKHFNLIEINMWGDKTVTLLDGKELTEKEFAKQMKIMFTPTLVILDNKGQSQFRMNGYYAPDKFLSALDYSLLKSELVKSGKSLADLSSFNDYFKAVKKAQVKPSSKQAKARPNIKTEKFIHKSSDLAGLIKSSKKPVMLLFEQAYCPECDELHGDVFRRLPVFKQLKQFTIAQVDVNSDKIIIGPKGQSMTQKELAAMLDIQYTPSMLFYEAGNNKVVFRSDAYLKNFHVQALFDYVLTQAYLTEPEFQRFVQRRADRMREEGQEVDLWD